MKVAVIGATRRKNGTGEYIAKFFHQQGSCLVALLGRTTKSAKDASDNLKKYRINAVPYDDFDRMMDRETPDVVAIASPQETHREYLSRCSARGVHIFCEKPFIWPPGDMTEVTDEVLAGNPGKVLAINTQWVHALPHYENLWGKINPRKVSSFTARLSPGVTELEDMIPDSMPHVLSLLYTALGPGKIRDVTAGAMGRSWIVEFCYQLEDREIAVRVELSPYETQPRPMSFGFDGKMASREIRMPGYLIYFSNGERVIPIEDPLKLSVADFIDAVINNREPVAGRKMIIHNHQSLKELFNGIKTNRSSINRKCE